MEIDLDILMILTLLGMLIAIFSGVHIALALGATAMVGTYFIFEDLYMAASQVGGAAYELIRDHIFMTIPLFVLMGDFLCAAVDFSFRFAALAALASAYPWGVYAKCLSPTLGIRN